MAAFIICPSPNEWDIIEPFLNKCRQGAIVVTPKAKEDLKKQGLDLDTQDGVDKLIDYDFGGEADILIDVVRDTEHMAIGDVIEQLDIANTWKCECGTENLPGSPYCRTCSEDRPKE